MPQALAIDCQLHDEGYRTSFAAHNQHDVLKNVTCSLPFRHKSNTYIARTPGGRGGSRCFLGNCRRRRRKCLGNKQCIRFSGRNYSNEKDRRLRALSLPAAVGGSRCVRKPIKCAYSYSGMRRPTESNPNEGNRTRRSY